MADEAIQRACEALPLFPLPGTVLMPGSLLPLRVFEPRFVALVEHCLRDPARHMLSVPQIRPGKRDAELCLNEADERGIFRYASVGRIGAHQHVPDGRYNALIQPLARIRVEEILPASAPYPVARATALDDVPVRRVVLAAAGDRLRATFAPVVAQMGQVGKGVARALASLPGERVPDALASVVLRTDEDRQAFLSNDHPLARAELVHTHALLLLAQQDDANVAEA